MVTQSHFEGRNILRVIIIGAGEVGYHIAQRLAVENKEVVVIDKSADAIRKLAEASDLQIGRASCRERV